MVDVQDRNSLLKPTLKVSKSLPGSTNCSLLKSKRNLTLSFEDVVLLRGPKNEACTNIPYQQFKSNRGIEWGFEGQGPLDLSLNILFYFGITRSRAMELADGFCLNFIIPVPFEGGVIPKEKIIEWIVPRLTSSRKGANR